MKEFIPVYDDLILCQKCANYIQQVRGSFPHFCYMCKKKKKAEQARILSWFKK